MSFFRIIMPNYNNSKWLEKSIGSVIGQTFKDYTFVFVDDVSTDDSVDKADRLIKQYGVIVGLDEKRWNGGARNVGLRNCLDGEYTLFLDSDDWFYDENVLQNLHDFIVDEDYPDCVRLPFGIEYDVNKSTKVMLDDDNAEKLVNSIFVASWSKCVKSELVPLFPENTLMEDAVQHIKQCDMIAYPVAVFNKPFLVYNKNNSNSCSSPKNQTAQNAKWQSSMYRHMADLLDLELNHDYCIKQRDIRAKRCLDNIKNDKYIQ